MDAPIPLPPASQSPSQASHPQHLPHAVQNPAEPGRDQAQTNGPTAALVRWLRRPHLSPLASFLASLVVLVVLTGMLHQQVLLHGAVYHMDDAADNYYPARVAFKRALSEGTLPSWEPNALCGWPLLSDPYYGYFYPLNFVFYLGARKGEPISDQVPDLVPAPKHSNTAGVPSGLGYSAVLHTLLAGVGMLLLLRRRTSDAAALLGAVAYLLSSFLVVRVRHIIFVQLAAWLPFLLAAIDAFITTQKRSAWLRCAIFTGLLLLTGAHSLLHFAALLLAGYATARLGSQVLAQLPGKRLPFLLRTGGALLGAAVVGACLAMVALLPTLMAMKNTSRSLGTDYQFASSYAWPTWKYWQTLLMPDLMGVGEWRGASWVGKWNHWELCGYYQGVLALLLALPGGLWRLREPSTGRWQLERPALLALCAIGVLAALGDQGPVHPFLFKHFPLYGALRCPSRALFLLVPALPILLAHGADLLFGDARKPQSQATNPSVSPLLPSSWRSFVLLGVGMLLALGCYAVGHWQSLTQLRASTKLPLEASLHAASLSHLYAVLGGILAIAALRWVGRLAAVPALLLLSLCTASDQLPILKRYLQPRPLAFPTGTERFAAVEWLLKNQSPATTLPSSSLPLYDRFVPDPRGPFRLLAAGETFDRPGVSGYSSIQIWRYSHLLYIMNAGQPYPHAKLRDDLAAAMVWNLNSPLLDTLNVRYLLSAQSPGPKWQLVYSPPKDTPLSARFEPMWDKALQVYENTQVMPRAFVAYQIRPAATVAMEAALTARADLAPQREIVLGQTAADGQAVTLPKELQQGGSPQPITPAQVVEYQRHRLVVQAEAKTAGVLVLSEAFYPGWTATVDGQPQPILPVNLALRGVLLTPGQHRIQLSYHDRSLQLGGLLSLLGLCGLGLVGLFRRRSPSAT